MRRQEILQTIELRQSTIKDFIACGLYFMFKHLEKIPETSRHSAALHGSALHMVINRFHTESWDLDLEKAYLEALDYYVNEKEIPVFWKESKEKYLANALEILKGYLNNEKNKTTKVLFSEVKFRVKIHGLIFTGTIDQVRLNKDETIELLDLKSSAQRPTLAFLQNDWQLSLYQYALTYGELYSNDIWIKPNLFPDFASWYFLRGHEVRKQSTVNGKVGEQKGEPLIRTQRGMEDMKLFKVELKKLLNVMLKDWYYANPDHCQLCGYKSHCTSRSQVISKESIPEETRKLIAELEVA